jgi:hypothetical protein
MLVEAIIFRSKNGLFHHGGHIVDADYSASFFTKLTDQVPVCRVNP